MNALKIMWAIMAGFFAFAVWIQVWIPIANGTTLPYITCAANNIPYAGTVVVIVNLFPLVTLLAILFAPIIGSDSSPQY